MQPTNSTMNNNKVRINGYGNLTIFKIDINKNIYMKIIVRLKGIGTPCLQSY